QQLHNSRKTQISDYDPKWIQLFEKELLLLHSIFGEVALIIHHIGSTAIPGIKAKPIIDILITTNSIHAIDNFDDQMEQSDYVIGGEFGLVGRRFYCKGDDQHCHFHVHVYEATHPSVEKYLLFRNYMINHPNDAKDYESLKTDLATKYPNNRTLYTQSKGEYIDKILEKAAALAIKP
ncbi:MAG: GrpB family protein, partial [Alphaproteobacteria bacterium]|nr:GrpB family protein [Alphaproteobacteria bacterium]